MNTEAERVRARKADTRTALQQDLSPTSSTATPRVELCPEPMLSQGSRHVSKKHHIRLMFHSVWGKNIDETFRIRADKGWSFSDLESIIATKWKASSMLGERGKMWYHARHGPATKISLMDDIDLEAFFDELDETHELDIHIAMENS